MVSDDRPDTGRPSADEPQGLVPPYDDLRGGRTTDAAEEGARKAFDASNAGPPGPPPPVSEQERSGMSSTDMDPEPPLGVGESRGGRAEDRAPDRPDVGTEGASGRPAGRAAEDDSDGSFRSDMPDLQAGDQGG